VTIPKGKAFGTHVTEPFGTHVTEPFTPSSNIVGEGELKESKTGGRELDVFENRCDYNRSPGDSIT
jgi:hypothetical protein